MSNKTYIFGLILWVSTVAVPVGATFRDNSPKATCSYLNNLGLSTRGWKNYFPSEYGCSSPYKDLGSAFLLKNNLVYAVSGGAKKAKKLELYLNVHNKEEARLAHHELLKAATSLLNKAVAKDLPQILQNAIKKGINATATVGGVTIELIRNNWSTGKGYDLKFSIE